MTNPEAEANQEITHSPALRNMAFDFLPPEVHRLKKALKVEYWPTDMGELKLTISYDPASNYMDIETEEVVNRTYPDPLTTHNFMIYKGVEMDCADGRILNYGEGSDVRDQFGRLVPSEVETETRDLPAEFEEAENSALHPLDAQAYFALTPDKLDHFFTAFENL